MLDFLLLTGHSLHEYQLLFLLTQCDLNKKILDIGGGFSSFNAELTKIGGSVVSIDLLYDHDKLAIGDAIDKYDKTPMGHGRVSFTDELTRAEKTGIISKKNSEAAKLFAQDYIIDRLQERYQWALLPAINFPRNSFDLALSSHVLFYQSKDYAPHFHIETIENMVYVAKEARIAPLVQVDGEVSPHIDEVVNGLRVRGHRVDFIENQNADYRDKRIMVVSAQ